MPLHTWFSRLWRDPEPINTQRHCFPILPNANPIATSISLQRMNPYPKHTLALRWGSLTQATAPIVAGHYEGDAIMSAERVIDQALGGRLSELAQLGIYPGRLPSCEILLTPTLALKGVIIMGLGVAGELDSDILQQAWVNALLRYALDSQARQNDKQHFQLSCLLVGSQSQTLTLTQVLRCVLNAAFYVQQRLGSESPNTPPPTFALEWIEIDAYRALEASDILLQLLQQPELEDKFTLLKVLTALPPSMQSVPMTKHNNKNWWTQIVLFNLAPSSEQNYPPLSQKFITQLQNESNLILVLDESSAIYEWEALVPTILPALPQQALALQVGLVRQFIGQHYGRHQARLAQSQILWCQAVDSSDTLLSGWDMDTPNYALHSVLGLQPEDVFCHLHQQYYNLIHWQSTVTLNDNDIVCVLNPDTNLALSDWQQLRNEPQMLVLMLEYLSEISDITWYAWVKNLLALGLQVLVLNRHNWSTAERDVFLSAFYQALRNGESVGIATLKGRQNCATVYPDGQWATLQCYGDAEYRLI